MRRIGAGLALALTAACGSEQVGEGSGAAGREERADAREDTLTDTLRIEGMAELVELRRVESPSHFPLPFSTYVPPGLEVDEADRGDQAEVRFVTDFGAGEPGAAWLEVSAYPAGLTEEEALERARRAAGDSARRLPADDPVAPWVIGAWRVAGKSVDGRTGLVLLGRHDERHFHVRMLHPPEYGDGFGPRAALVLRHWRWRDGTPLRAEDPPALR